MIFAGKMTLPWSRRSFVSSRLFFAPVEHPAIRYWITISDVHTVIVALIYLVPMQQAQGLEKTPNPFSGIQSAAFKAHIKAQGARHTMSRHICGPHQGLNATIAIAIWQSKALGRPATLTTRCRP